MHWRGKRYSVGNFQTYIQSILTIGRFHTCKLAYLLKFICNSKINAYGAFMATYRYVPSGEKFKSLDVCIPSWDQTEQCSAFFFHCFIVPFSVYLVPSSPPLFFWKFCFWKCSMHSTEVCSVASKCKKAAMCLPELKHMLHKLCSA